ncbi:hypothetical protein CYJ27_03155 [Aerococcus christensenii]|uniref:Uncharacterized protein n=1 Tax=Aerococcus christensenii TaxID=87541 RepID=A0A133XU71_9LACT|nr:hypothetical protein HMPREF3187_01383 [Aerococcus christensenii]PKY91685.1 hypothetical protein CYJ27_03155 [Aerococcus christensenii]
MKIKMDKKNLWLILTIIAFIALLTSIFMSYKTGKTEYAWIIGSMLFGIGCGDKYRKLKNK